MKGSCCKCDALALVEVIGSKGAFNIVSSRPSSQKWCNVQSFYLLHTTAVILVMLVLSGF